MSAAVSLSRRKDRGSILTDAVRVLDWVRQRERPFIVGDLALGAGLHRRVAYRWLRALCDAGAVEVAAREEGRLPRIYRRTEQPPRAA